MVEPGLGERAGVGDIVSAHLRALLPDISGKIAAAAAVATPGNLSLPAFVNCDLACLRTRKVLSGVGARVISLGFAGYIGCPRRVSGRRIGVLGDQLSGR